MICKRGGEDRVSIGKFQRMCARSPISPFPSSQESITSSTCTAHYTLAKINNNSQLEYVSSFEDHVFLESFKGFLLCPLSHPSLFSRKSITSLTCMHVYCMHTSLVKINTTCLHFTCILLCQESIQCACYCQHPFPFKEIDWKIIYIFIYKYSFRFVYFFSLSISLDEHFSL